MENEYENFNNVIQKAVIAYKNSNNDDLYWLPEVREPIITDKDKEELLLTTNYLGIYVI